MDRERAKELLPIIQAFAEGKSIEGRPCPNSEWGPVTTSHFMDGWEFRIKPEPRVFWLDIHDLEVLEQETNPAPSSGAWIKVMEIL